ncbi:ATP-binding region, ATPase-like [Burkholderia cenocepacia PC184]|nr:ATP-binding region, ATPase-like [Burkholderia cenocepacia PC184]
MREAMEDTLVDTAQVLATLAADDMANGHIADGTFARQLGKLHERPGQRERVGYPEERDRLPPLHHRRARHRALRLVRQRARAGLFALERRVPDAARRIRRAQHAQRSERRRQHRDARGGADPARQRDHRRADDRETEPDGRAVHRAQPAQDHAVRRVADGRRDPDRRRVHVVAGARVAAPAALCARDRGRRARVDAAAGRKRTGRARARGGKHASAAGRPPVRRNLHPHAHARDEKPAGRDQWCSRTVAGRHAGREPPALHREHPPPGRPPRTDDPQAARAGRGRAEAAAVGARAGRAAAGARTARRRYRAARAAARREPADRCERCGRSRGRRRRSVPAAAGARQPARQRAGFRAARQHDPDRARAAAGGAGARRGRARRRRRPRRARLCAVARVRTLLFAAAARRTGSQHRPRAVFRPRSRDAASRPGRACESRGRRRVRDAHAAVGRLTALHARHTFASRRLQSPFTGAAHAERTFYSGTCQQ